MSDNQTQTPPAAGAPPIQPAASSGTTESQARTWNMLCHLSALAGFIIPFGHILGPLLVWQIKKNEIPSTDIHGKAALNFQITVTILAIAGAIVAVILSFIGIGILLFPLVFLIGLCGLIFAIVAGIKANNGQAYKYPYSFELVK